MCVSMADGCVECTNCKRGDSRLITGGVNDSMVDGVTRTDSIIAVYSMPLYNFI